MNPISRRGPRLALRELASEDTDAVFAIYSSPQATEHLSFEPRSHDQVHQILERSIASATARPREEYALAVVERSSGRLIGFGRLATDPHQPRAATFGFALHPGFWGMGYGTETVLLLLGLGFEDLELHRIWGARAPHNEASARTMRAAGMAEEGRIREHIHKRGAWRDSIVHAILDHEWHNTVRGEVQEVLTGESITTVVEVARVRGLTRTRTLALYRALPRQARDHLAEALAVAA